MPASRTNCAMDDPDAWLGGRLHLHQPRRGSHRAGTDAVLLARLCEPPAGSVVCDVGAGSGAVGLSLAVCTQAGRVVLVERDPILAAMAGSNASLNGLADRVEVIEADVLAPAAARHAAGLLPNRVDLVLTNPPYFDRNRQRSSPVAGKAAAHSYEAGDLDAWLRTCVELLKPDGRIGMIHRADALPECLDALRNRFGDIRVRPVHAFAEAPAIRILITATKGSRAPFHLRPALVLQDAEGRFRPEVEALHRGGGWIDPS